MLVPLFLDNKVAGVHWWESVIIASWMITTVVLTKSYSSNLMSTLAVRYIPQSYKTLQDVVDDPSVTMVWETNNAYVQYFRVSC